MSVHTLDIDSGERDPIAYPNPGDYVVELKNPIYNVSKISLVSARIHASQFLINDRNKTFDFVVEQKNNCNITLTPGNYSGNSLATELQTKVNAALGGAYVSSPIDFSYDKDKNELVITSLSSAAPAGSEFSFKFYDGTNGYHSSVATEGYTTPHDILGLPASNIRSNTRVPPEAQGLLITGSINLQGPDALILKISSGAEELNKTVYSDTPFYTGRILMCGDVINYSGIDDAVEHNFESGSQNISKLRIQFFYSSNNRLIPYDFRSKSRVKIIYKRDTDKLSRVPVVKKGTELQNEKRTEGYRLPPNIQGKVDDLNKWNAFIYIFLIVLTGCFFMVFTKPRRLSE